MAKLKRPAGRRLGAALLQIAVAAGIAVIGLGIAGAALSRAQTTSSDSARRTSLDRRRAQGIDAVIEALQDAGASSIATDLSASAAASALTFRTKIGFSGDAPTYSETTTIEWVIDTRETDNGRDDDGDELVDEGFVRMTIGTGGTARSVVLVRDVCRRLEGETANTRDDNGNGVADERGLLFLRSGNRIRVWLSVSGRMRDGTTSVRTMGGSVDVSN